MMYPKRGMMPSSQHTGLSAADLLNTYASGGSVAGQGAQTPQPPNQYGSSWSVPPQAPPNGLNNQQAALGTPFGQRDLDAEMHRLYSGALAPFFVPDVRRPQYLDSVGFGLPSGMTSQMPTQGSMTPQPPPLQQQLGVQDTRIPSMTSRMTAHGSPQTQASVLEDAEPSPASLLSMSTSPSNVKQLVENSKFHDEILCQLLDAARLNLIGAEAKKALQRAARARVIELRDMRHKGEVSPDHQSSSHADVQLGDSDVLITPKKNKEILEGRRSRSKDRKARRNSDDTDRTPIPAEAGDYRHPRSKPITPERVSPKHGQVSVHHTFRSGNADL